MVVAKVKGRVRVRMVAVPPSRGQTNHDEPQEGGTFEAARHACTREWTWGMGRNGEYRVELRGDYQRIDEGRGKRSRQIIQRLEQRKTVEREEGMRSGGLR